MDTFWAVLAIVGALSLGVISPGPSFILVARVAVARSRAAALASALGMGVGGVLFALAALAGLKAVFALVPSAYLVLKVAGGAYLLWLATRLWRGAREPLPAGDAQALAPSALRREFGVGLATQVSNPKTALVYASVFAALMPAQPSAALWWLLPLAVFVVEAGWYALVALALSAAAPRAGYLRHKALLDRVAALALGALGARLVASGARESV